MTVELESPFIWPEPPEDREPWQEEYSDAMEANNERDDKLRAETKDTVIDEAKQESMREQAKALLEGRKQWTPLMREKAYIPPPQGRLSRR